MLREIAVQEGATLTAEDVLKLYDEALDDINDEIAKIKANFQRRYGLNDETASYFLTQAQQEENLAMLINALEEAPNEKARRDILEYIHRDGLSVRAYASRIERYNVVKQSIYARVKKLAAEQTALVTGMLKKAYSESYYGNIDDTAKGLNVGISFGILNDDAINEAVTAKWHGKRFSERIWDNTDRLAREAQDLVVKSLMSGESLTKTAQKLSESFQVEKYHATTLVHTETAHIHAMADMKAYEDLGIEEYKYLATLDYVTCETCQPLDGKVFKLSEAVEGVNYPTMHPRCRCTTTINMDFNSRRARNPLTGKNEIIDGDMTYSEWVKSLTPEQKSALELSRKKDANKTADKLQFAEYKNRLGTKVTGRSFDKWQEMKYTDLNKWATTKTMYREKEQAVYEARASELFYVVPPPNGDAIKAQSIFKELRKSEIGRETLEYIQEYKPNIEINYTNEAPKGMRGRVYGKNIDIYARNTRTVLITSQTVIHEVTHMKYDIGGSQWAEAVCFAQERKHIKGELTFADKRDIIKEVKKLYPNLKWR